MSGEGGGGSEGVYGGIAGRPREWYSGDQRGFWEEDLSARSGGINGYLGSFELF